MVVECFIYNYYEIINMPAKAVEFKTKEVNNVYISCLFIFWIF